jgi:hypothetical protein
MDDLLAVKLIEVMLQAPAIVAIDPQLTDNVAEGKGARVQSAGDR